MTHTVTATTDDLDRLWGAGLGVNVHTLELGAATKLAILSDLHMGDGSGSDDLRRNTDAVTAALQYYRTNRFTVVLLGDVEDLWKFDLAAVERQYGATIYSVLSSFGGGSAPPCRIRVFGNHDIDWRGVNDPAAGPQLRPPPGVPEAVTLERGGRRVALLVHGHQGSIDSDKAAWFSRFFVRLWRFIEPAAHAIGWYPTNPSATQCAVMGDFERSMYAWAKRARAILICGHSHRAYFGSRSRADVLHEQIDTAVGAGKPVDPTLKARRKELRDERRKGRDIGPLDEHDRLVPCYFNAGCGLYTTGITAIELEGAADGTVRLVFWATESRARAVWQEEALGLASGAGLLRALRT